MEQMEHPYLFTPGEWKISGVYKAGNEAIPVDGTRTVLHKDSEEVWTLSEEMRSGEDGTEYYRNDADILPFSPDKLFTVWEGNTNRFGRVVGKFIIVKETIMSTFVSKDGVYTGNEYLAKVSDDEYTSDGFLFSGNEEIGSWSIRLVRVK